MSVEVISRRQLVQAAHTAIVRTGGVTPELRQALLEVANTATRISPDKWWDRMYDTGCLVGIYRNSQGLGASPFGDPHHAILGGKFTRALRQIAGPGASLYECHEPPLDLDVDLPEPLLERSPLTCALVSIDFSIVLHEPEEEPVSEEPVPALVPALVPELVPTALVPA